MKTITIVILILFFATAYSQVDNTTFKDNNGITIEIQSYKFDKIESKVQAVSFWCTFTNYSKQVVDEYWNKMYLKASDGKYVEAFFVSPTMRNPLKPADNISGIVIFKSERTIENSVFFISSNTNTEPSLAFKDIKEQSNTKLYDDYKVAMLKIRFDMDSFGDSPMELYNQVKPNLEDMNNYMYNFYLKYELMGDFKRGIEKSTDIKEIFALYKKSYDLGNRESFFIEKKYKKYGKMLFTGYLEQGNKSYADKDYLASFKNYKDAYSFDSTRTDKESLEMVYSYARSIFSLWDKDRQGYDLDYAIYLLDKLSNNNSYSEKCKALFLKGWAYDTRYAQTKYILDKSEAIDAYKKITDGFAGCSPALMEAAKNNRDILEKE